MPRVKFFALIAVLAAVLAGGALLAQDGGGNRGGRRGRGGGFQSVGTQPVGGALPVTVRAPSGNPTTDA